MGELTSERTVGRPKGTNESIESLAKKSAQRDLKLLEKNSKTIEVEMDRLEVALAGHEPGTEDYERMFRLLLLAKDAFMKNVVNGARIAATDPTKAGDGDLDAGTRELISQLKGDG